jgi:hypothetical protein
MFTLKNALLVVALASQSAMCGLVYGQATPPLKTEKFAAGEASRVGAMFKGKENPEPVLIKRYVQNEVARFSNVTAESDMGSFATIRTQLISNIRSSASEPAKKIAADHLLLLAKGIAASPNFHAIARINCVAALSELELVSNSPYAETFMPLVDVARNESQPLQLRAIALYGLNRHVKLTKLPPANAEGLAKAITVLVASKPKTALDVKAHAWVVRRGFDVLSSLAANHAVAPALARLLDDKELPSVRLAAADYLPRIDQSKLKLTDEQKIQYFVGLAQLLEQQLVMWYEREEDTLNMKSGGTGMGFGGGMDGGMGGMGGMGMGGMDGGGMGGYGGGMEGGMGGMEGGMGGMEGGMGGMGGYGAGGEGGMGMGPTGPKPRPLDTQPWEVRMTRRQVNQILQTAHIALDGKAIKGGRPVSAVGKGLVDLELPAEIANPASDLLKAVESMQNRVNDSTKITTMNSLISQTKKLIERIMDQVREVPALTAQYPKYQEKKEELGDVLDQPKAAAPASDPSNPDDPKKEGAGDPPAASGAPAEAGKPADGN